MPKKSSSNTGEATAPDQAHEKYQLLRIQPIFDVLSDDDIHALAEHCDLHTYDSKESVFLESEVCDAFYIVDRGRARTYKLAPNGREHTMEIFHPGECFALVPVIDHGRYPASAAVLETATLLKVPAWSINQLTQDHPELNESLLKEITKRLRNLSCKLEDLALRSLESRLARWILEQMDEVGESDITIDVSQELFATQLGTVRQVLHRVFRSLEDASLISRVRRNIHVIDADGLRQLSESSH